MSTETEANPVMRRRIQIFESALALFSERGFEAVGLREIAEHAGVSKSLIHRHFQSKDGLRTAVDQHVIGRFEEMLGEVFQAEPGASTRAAARGRGARLTQRREELLPLLQYLRHSLLENSEAGHAMFRRYLEGVGRTWDMDVAKAQGRKEEQLWFLLGVMFMQLGPVLLASQIEALTGRDPYSAESIKARALAYSLIYEGMKGARKGL